MSGRTYILILFFWAILTIVTPILVRLSANAKQMQYYNGEIMEKLKASGEMGLSYRRALVSRELSKNTQRKSINLSLLAPTQSAAPTPGPAQLLVLEGEEGFGMKRLLPAFGMKRILPVLGGEADLE